MEEALQKDKLGLLADLAYCLIHGVVLFSLSYIFFMMWYLPTRIMILGVSLAFLDIFSWLFIVFLGYAFLFLLAGSVNATLARYLWSIKTRSNGTIWMTEGLLIVIITQVLLLPLPVIQTILTGMALWLQSIFVVLIFLDYCLAFGLIGRKIARIYCQPIPYEQRVRVENKQLGFSGTRARCPYCQASFRYRDDDRAMDGTVKCHRCTRSFYMEPIDDLMRKLGENIDVNSRIDL
jgi:predicted Zn finger-like uncharacterized protein